MEPEWIIWLVFFAGWAAGWRLRSPPRCPKTSSGDRSAVSIIIPARDEEARLPALLDSLNAQAPPPEEILVVDDGSADRTAEIARAAGARVLASAPLPASWRGKAWACQQGADAAVNDTLIFMDADTRLEPGGLQALCSAFAQTGGALSAAAFQILEKPVEQLSAFFVRVMSAASELFGPFLLVSKADYQAVGGHAAVKNRILENVYLAEEFKNAGIPLRCVAGQGVLSIRMYSGGLCELAGGWKKAFASGASRTPPTVMTAIIGWLSAAAGTVVMLPVAALTDHSLLLWGALYIAFVRQLFTHLRRLGQFRFVTALFYPVALLFFFAVFAASAIQKQENWKGRAYAD